MLRSRKPHQPACLRCAVAVALALVAFTAGRTGGTFAGQVCRDSAVGPRCLLRSRVPCWCGAACEGSERSIEAKIREVFLKNMACQNVPLLKDFETYALSLPVRECSDRVRILFELEFFCRNQDLERAAIRLTTHSPTARSSAAYIAAPSNSGKSASALPLFLRSIELGGPFTHYLYMPFANNNRNRHSEVDSDLTSGRSKQTLQAMGAAYMLASFKAQMLGKYVRRWEPPSPLPTLVETETELKGQVLKFLNQQKGKLLVHVDEHCSMCEDPHFRRGALTVLADLKTLVTVLATDIPALPAMGSSETCRFAIGGLPLDVSAIMESRPELHVQEPKTVEEKRLMASAKVLLGLAIQSFGIGDLHVPNSQVCKFFGQLKPANQSTSLKETLTDWVKQCSEQALQSPIKRVEMLADLLIGIKEDDQVVQEQRFRQVFVMDDLVTAPLDCLLNCFDAGQDQASDLFRTCQAEFTSALMREEDLCAGKLLERAYLWSLAVRSAKGSLNQLGKQCLNFTCHSIAPGRVFIGTNTSLDAKLVAALMPGVLYYADEDRLVKHPRADMFFVTEGFLYLIEVGGGCNIRGATEKTKNLRKTVQQAEADGIKTRAVVLLPNVDCPIKGIQQDSGVQVVIGRGARLLLGGLAQLLPWYGNCE